MAFLYLSSHTIHLHFSLNYQVFYQRNSLTLKQGKAFDDAKCNLILHIFNLNIIVHLC